MANIVEYIWLDGYLPEPNLRSKSKVLPPTTSRLTLDDLPNWSFDGSSTKQAPGTYSDCVLKPVALIKNPLKESTVYSAYWLALCEVFEADGVTPHKSNTRALVPNSDKDWWFGFEQEYTLLDPETKRPLGFPHSGYPEGQGEYYCGVGHHAVKGRELVEKHLDLCLKAGLNLTGINAEVMLGQWEFQLLGEGIGAADDLWLARYILERLAEEEGLLIELHPKPVKGDWNGSGLHTNFSTKAMREEGGKVLFDDILAKLSKTHKLHIKEYGSSNNERLTGAHETSPITKFSYGESNRGCSVRIPLLVAKEWKGYLEDRRPASNADPYRIVAQMVKTLD